TGNLACLYQALRDERVVCRIGAREDISPHAKGEQLRSIHEKATLSPILQRGSDAWCIAGVLSVLPFYPHTYGGSLPAWRTHRQFRPFVRGCSWEATRPDSCR